MRRQILATLQVESSMREPPPAVTGSPSGGRLGGGLLTVRQVAAYLGVSEKTLRRLIATKGLRCFHVGRLARIDPGDVSRWLAARKE